MKFWFTFSENSYNNLHFSNEHMQAVEVCESLRDLDLKDSAIYLLNSIWFVNVST